MSRLVINVPLRLNGTQNRREHWGQTAERTAYQRRVARAAVLGHLPRRAVRLWQGPSTGPLKREPLREATPDWLPCTVTLVRIGPVRIDSDNVVASCKAVRDGIAQALGVDDGSELYTWRYDQARTRDALGSLPMGQRYGVRITIEPTNGFPNGLGIPDEMLAHRVNMRELEALALVGCACERWCGRRDRGYCLSPHCPALVFDAETACGSESTPHTERASSPQRVTPGSTVGGRNCPRGRAKNSRSGTGTGKSQQNHGVTR